MLVKDIMTKDPITIEVGSTVLEAEKLMSINSIGRLIVVDEGEVVGILTDGDLMTERELDSQIDEIMTTELITVQDNDPVKEAARILSEKRIGGLPVLNEEGTLVGIISAEDMVYGYMENEDEFEMEEASLTPESSAIYLSMTRSREYEKYWLKKVNNYGYKGAITQTGANAEKLPIKLRESTTVAAIARGVISENPREKIAVSNAVKDAYSQLALINPGLGGGFKVAVVKGQSHVSVAIFGKFGHALVDGPEQLAVGTSVI